MIQVGFLPRTLSVRRIPYFLAAIRETDGTPLINEMIPGTS